MKHILSVRKIHFFDILFSIRTYRTTLSQSYVINERVLHHPASIGTVYVTLNAL